MLIIQPNQVSVVPGTTATTALFSSPKYVVSASIGPLVANTGVIAFDYSSTTPINQGTLNLPALPNGRLYDLSKIYVKAGNTSDGVLVIYMTNPA